MMSDTGRPLPDADPARSGARTLLLRRIAEALDLPVTAFAGGPAPSASESGPTAVECAAMVAAFSRIKDPAVRRSCLEMLERCADT